MVDRDGIIKSYENGNLLETLHTMLLEKFNEQDDLILELTALHNEGLIDVIATFESLQNESSNKHDFFQLRHILEMLLPNIEAKVPSVLRCVLRLYTEAGRDLASGMIIKSFVDFCNKVPSRPDEALKCIEESPNELVGLLSPVLISGSNINSDVFVEHAIRLSEDGNIEIRRNAIYAIGRINFHDGFSPRSSLNSLNKSSNIEDDDQIHANIVTSACSLAQIFPDEEERIIEIINTSLSKGSVHTYYAAANILALNSDKVSGPVLDMLLDHLSNMDTSYSDSLGIIDLVISNLIRKGQHDKGISLLENLLHSDNEHVKMSIFNSSGIEILRNDNLISTILTRWFISGDLTLCNAIHEMITSHHIDNFELHIDPNEIQPGNSNQLIFIARKTIGYLFLRPITVMSVLISLMQEATDDETSMALGSFLFNPMLLNYTGSARDYLERRAEQASGSVEEAINDSLKSIDSYLDDLRSIGELNALKPSEDDVEAYRRHFNRLMRESYKEAESKSVLLSIVSKSVLLYGRKSISYVYQSNGESRRTEVPMKSHGVQIEFPRMQNLDPFGLDYMLRIFRAEKLRT